MGWGGGGGLRKGGRGGGREGGVEEGRESLMGKIWMEKR